MDDKELGILSKKIGEELKMKNQKSNLVGEGLSIFINPQGDIGDEIMFSSMSKETYLFQVNVCDNGNGNAEEGTTNSYYFKTYGGALNFINQLIDCDNYATKELNKEVALDTEICNEKLWFYTYFHDIILFSINKTGERVQKELEDKIYGEYGGIKKKEDE